MEDFDSSRAPQRDTTMVTRKDFPGGAVVKNLPANAGDASLIPGSGRSPGVGNGNPFQHC